MFLLEHELEKFARFFAHQIMNIRQLCKKPIIVKVKGELGSGKTVFFDNIKSFLTNSTFISGGLSYGGLMCTTFKVGEQTYKMLHLDASLMQTKRLSKSIPKFDNINEEYNFIFIEHHHFTIYNELNQKMKGTIINIDITSEGEGRNFEITSKDCQIDEVVTDVESLTNAEILENYIPESDKIPLVVLKELLHEQILCKETSRMKKIHRKLNILTIDATCDDPSMTLTKRKSDGSCEILCNMIDTFKQFGSIHDYLELGPFIELKLKEMYEKIKALGIKLDLICVSNSPGLPISLQHSMIFAINTARELRVPVWFLNHIFSHLYAGLNWNTSVKKFSGIVLSGGHFVFVTHDNVFKVLYESNTDTIGGVIDKLWRLLKETMQPFGLHCEIAMNEYDKNSNKAKIEELIKKIGEIKNMSNIKDKVSTLIYQMLLTPYTDLLLEMYKNCFSEHHFEEGIQKILDKYKRQETIESILSSPIEEIEYPLYGRLIGVEETSVLVAYIQKYKDKIIDAEMKLQIKTSRLTPCVVASCDIAPCDKSIFDACLDKYRTLLEAPNSTKKPSLNDFLQEIFTVIPRSKDFVGLFATVIHILIGNFLKKILNENVKHIKENGNRFIGAGGVMCNGYLTLIIETFCKENEIEYVPTPKELCADNSIMVCMHACHKLAELNEIDNDAELEKIAFELGLQVPRGEATGENVLLRIEKVTVGQYKQ